MTAINPADYHLGRCPSCGSENTSVRWAKKGWFFVGCTECDNKRLCDEKYLDETVEMWEKYAEKIWAGRCEK